MVKKSFLETEIQKYLEILKPPEKPGMFKGEHYIGAGQSKLKYLDLKTSDVRGILKKNLSVFKLPLEKQFEEFEKIWFESDIFEMKAVALYWLSELKDETLIKFSPRIIQWSKEIDNWALSDWLSSVYARVFEKSPKVLLKTFQLWNQHQNPWLRRLSMVSLFYYARMRKRHPAYYLASRFVIPHLLSNDYYVQKAVGWTLREMYQVYPNKTLQLMGSKLKDISSIAWVAASEKLPSEIKKNLLAQRKKVRAKTNKTKKKVVKSIARKSTIKKKSRTKI